jgi:hypothetical protein
MCEKCNESHNRGGRDASQGSYNPPYESVTDLARNIMSGETRQERAERDAYDKGHDMGSRQR